MSQPESTIPEIDSPDMLESEPVRLVTVTQAPVWQLEPMMAPQITSTAGPQTQTRIQTRKRKKRSKGKKVIRLPPPPTSDTPATRDPRGPAVRQWIYGIEVDEAYLDAWAKEMNDGNGNGTDEEIDSSEFISEMADYCRNNRVPISVKTGYTGRMSPHGDFGEEVSVLKMTDNEFGSRTVEEIPQRWVQVCRSFMKKDVIPMWYVRA